MGRVGQVPWNSGTALSPQQLMLNGLSGGGYPDPHKCWNWTKGISQHGYGKFTARINGKRQTFMAHRVAWECFRGQIAAGYALDHLCQNKLCCNPDHLEPVTHAENSRRGKRHQRLGIQVDPSGLKPARNQLCLFEVEGEE